MHDLNILNQLAVIFAVAVAVVLLLGKIGVPTIAGMILAGVLAGPNGLGIVTEVEGLETLAEVGVVLLLFTIGLEFAPDRILRIWKLITLGGSLQVVLTAAATLALVLAFGRPFAQGLFAGFLMALSSTAIVLRALAERGETDAPHGRIIVGVLIFQDMCIVPMMLLVPMLAGAGEVSAFDFLLAVGGA
ncbi:MAG: cation:proton antiporter, partial [SAR324 cluster bacterium]|nr:cation:proton antiporter [SAR324 cluster bacterium]